MSSLIFGVVEENLGENIFLPRVAASVRNIPVLAGEGVSLLYNMALTTLIFIFYSFPFALQKRIERNRLNRSNRRMMKVLYIITLTVFFNFAMAVEPRVGIGDLDIIGESIIRNLETRGDRRRARFPHDGQLCHVG